MSLIQNNIIDYDDFVNLKNNILNECGRRSTTAVSPSLGNDYSQNGFSTIPSINSISQFGYFEASFLNQILKILKDNFTEFPGELPASYSDGSVSFNDYIYALKTLLDVINDVKDEPWVSNDDCRSGCMGLCTNSCNNTCSNSCRNGCKGCTATCANSCNNDCFSGCTTACGGNCRTECTGGCGGCSGSYCGASSCWAVSAP